jgi:hypothetical protein
MDSNAIERTPPRAHARGREADDELRHSEADDGRDSDDTEPDLTAESPL